MVKRLVQYLKGYVFFIFVILVFALINVVTTLLIPVLIGNAIDCIIDFNNVNFEQINKILFFIFLCILVGNIDRKSTRLNSSHNNQSRMPSSA